LLDRLTRNDRNGRTALERIIASYRNPAAAGDRARYWLLHKAIDHFRGDADPDAFREGLAGRPSVVRGMVVAARSVAEFGLTVPQKFSAPLFAVWNFTNRCNLACRHCYQDSEHDELAGELTLDEKLDLVDQMGRAHMPMLALSGGEPTICDHLLPVLRRASSYGMHLTLATNGTTLTPERAAELRRAGLRYVEISLDSVDPARHDAFRGRPGLWERTVRGARAVVAAEGLRLGIAMCVHQGNVHEVRDMIRFAEDLGAECFAHFNFIPVGRGLRMVSGDISPQQREELLAILNEKMQAGGMGVISTAPQLGRVCLAGAALADGRVSCSHAGAGSGVKARVVAKYLGGCGAGRTYVCIEPHGDVTPCVYLPHRVMGNVRRTPFMDIYRNSVFWRILNDRDHRLHHCEVCAFKQYCGGCRARADAYFGHLNAGDPGCIFNAKHWDALVAAGVVQPTDAPDDADAAADMELTPTRHGPG
jgi:radical SAM protein with 4Fe4S-binding SPASM domain